MISYSISQFGFFRHLKLGIALAIPASNECKIGTNNSAAQGLRYLTPSGMFFVVFELKIGVNVNI